MAKKSTRKNQITGEKTVKIGKLDIQEIGLESLEMSPGQSDFLAIADGIMGAGEALIFSGGKDRADQRLMHAAEHIQLLSIYRSSFIRCADELEAAADAAHNGHVGLGFDIFKSMIRIPDDGLSRKAATESSLSDLPDAVHHFREGMTRVKNAFDVLEEALRAERDAYSWERLPFNALSERSGRAFYMGRSTLVESATTGLGMAFIKAAGLIAAYSEFLEYFNFFGLCPNDECQSPGFASCTLASFRIYTPVRQFSSHVKMGDYKLSGGVAADVINDLADKLLDFLKTGALPKDALELLKTLLSGAGFAAVVKKMLSGAIGIDAVVEWIMKRIAPALASPVAAALAAALAIALGMAVYSVAVAKLYANAITQPGMNGVLICATLTYSVCINGMCYKYLVTKTIELKITPRSAGIFDMGLDIWSGQEPGGVPPKDLLQFQYLLDLIARLNLEIAKERDPVKKLTLVAQKNAAEAQLAAFKKVKTFYDDLKKKISAAACKAIENDPSLDGLNKANFTPCE